MSDLLAGRVHLDGFSRAHRLRRLLLRRRARRGRGLGQVHPVPRTATRDEFARFFARADTFTLGVCNGCQMMAALKRAGAGHRALAAFRAQSHRAVRGALQPGGDPATRPSVLLAGMAGSSAHRGRARRRPGGVRLTGRAAAACATAGQIALRYVDNRGQRDAALSGQSQWLAARHRGAHATRTAASRSPCRIRSACSAPCRIPGIPHKWGEDSGWMRMFRNARVWVN